MTRLPALAGIAAVLALAACGGSSSAPPAGSIVVKLSEYKFDPSTITHKSGSMTFFLENDGTAAHDMKIVDAQGNSVQQSDLVQPGNEFEFTVDIAKPGTYTFYCTQPGHKDAGMTGTLTVT